MHCVVIVISNKWTIEKIKNKGAKMIIHKDSELNKQTELTSASIDVNVYEFSSQETDEGAEFST